MGAGEDFRRHQGGLRFPGQGRGQRRRGQRRIGGQPRGFADPEFGDPPIGPGQHPQEFPRVLLADGQVGVVRLPAHLPGLHAHRKAEPQRDHRDDCPALRLAERRRGRVAADDCAGSLERIREPHHCVGGGDGDLGRAPAAHHVAEVDQAREAHPGHRGLHHHVVVVRVVVDHGDGEPVPHRVESFRGAREGRRDEFAPAGEVAQAVPDRRRGCLHPPGEVARQRRVIESGEGLVQLGEQHP